MAKGDARTSLEAAEALLQNRAAQRAQVLLDLWQRTFDSEDELTTYAISQLVHFTESSIGFIGRVDRSETTLTATYWSTQTAPGNTISDRPIRFDLKQKGPWAEALRSRKPMVTHHDDESNPLRAINPTGPLHLSRFMAIPVIREGRAVFLAGVGNKIQKYSESDQVDAAVFLEAVWEVIGRRRAAIERKELEEQLRASQKMEAIGRLAGGISHDFNNLLAVIVSCVEFALESTREGDQLRDDLQQIRNAAQRAAALTSQLLAFSRRQVLAQRPLDLNQTITGMEKMLRRIIGEDIELRLVLEPDLALVAADSSQLEQAVMNLTVNARDAMPTGGELILRTGNVDLSDAAEAHRLGVNPGTYVILAVADTGCGMDQATRERIFEPFFTLKGQKGSGLGLSTVYGIVKQSGGEIQVESEPGKGTTFTIYLPRTVQTTQAEPRSVRSATTNGSETILVVEDEELVCNLTVRMLSSQGYTVLSVANGTEALSLVEQHPAKIHLLLTDVIMPTMSGKVLADRLAAIQPGIKVLYMSGYTDDAILLHGVFDSGIGFIAKPFTTAELARKVREVLDTSSGSATMDTPGETYSEPKAS